MNNLTSKVVNWAEDKGILSNSDSKTQFLKLLEEVGELSESILKDRNPIDDIGDCTVVLTVIAAMNNLTLEECLEHAYNEIKGRTGQMIDGNFVKDE